jgi:hypothetical protein
MEIIDQYHRGLLFITFLLINSEMEISDNELYHIHKMRVEEGMTDEVFTDHFNSLIGKSGKEIYQIGIEAFNLCTAEYKSRAFVRLYQMAMADKVINLKELRFIFYSIGLSDKDIDLAIRSMRKQRVAA